jgi:hypothetical protein
MVYAQRRSDHASIHRTHAETIQDHGQAQLSKKQKLAFTLDDLPREKIERMAANRMDPEHAHLDSLRKD